jgi:hypothetical protein
MGEPRQDIDWSLTTWEGSRRAQLHRALAMTLRERLQAVEGLADTVRRFEEMRTRGEFTSALGQATTAQVTTGVHEPSHPYDAE